ncbi:MAG: glycosyltransferase [Gemmataceae bacterium]
MASRVSLCLIAKNEEGSLPTCLASTAGLFAETIVVDTGSTDRTREIAAAFGARVVEFPWVDSFAAARNEGLRHATGDWIFYLDADEYLEASNRDKLQDLLARLGDDNVAYVLQQRSRLAEDRASRLLLDRVCLFPHRPEHQWRYRVHEQIVPALQSTGVTLVRTEIAVEHTGYADSAATRRKSTGYLRLLELEYAERPDDASILFNFGWTTLLRGRPADALPLLRRAQERPRAINHLLPWIAVLEAACLRRIGRPGEALAVLEAARSRFPADATLILEEALLNQERGNLDRAEAGLRSLLNGPSAAWPAHEPLRYPGPVRAGLHGYLARHHLATVLAEAARANEAETECRAVLTDQPAFTPAAVLLGDLLVRQERWPEVEQILAALEGECGAPADAAVLRARIDLHRGAIDAARRIAEEALANHPTNVGLHVVLTHALLQAGCEDDAEVALRDVLRLDWAQAESWRNLAKLLRNQGRLAEAADVCDEGRTYCPDEPDLLRIQGLCLQEMNDATAAEPCLLRYLEVRAGRPTTEATELAHRTAVRYQLGRICRSLGRPADAEAHWLALVTEEPAYTAAWLELGNFYLAERRWPELAGVIHRLEADFRLTEDAALLRASGHLARDEFAAANRIVEQLLTANPESAAGRTFLDVLRRREAELTAQASVQLP